MEMGLKAMPGLIPTPNSGSFEKTRKIQLAKMEYTKLINVLKCRK